MYAVGDVARWGSGACGRRFEHWTNAVDQASALAGVLTGARASYDPQPYVWSEQLGSRLQVWGEILPDDEIAYVHGGADQEEFVAVSGRDGRLTGVAAFGARRAAARAARLLGSGAVWDAGQAGRGPAGARLGDQS